MNPKKDFFKTVWTLALPITLQSMLQASFSVVDQIMIGQLGSVQVAGVGLAGKFSSIFSVLVSAIAAVAGILLAQHLGQGDRDTAARGFSVNLRAATGAAALFTALCFLFPSQIMGIYTQDPLTRQAAASYLSILSISFLPMAGTVLFSVLLRCLDQAALPLCAGIASALLNTALNYLLIFGKLGVPTLGTEGAAVATALSQIANLLLLLFLYARCPNRLSLRTSRSRRPFNWKQYGAILLPVLVCELMWSLGENVYGAIYGHLGTGACAAMTLTNPIQALMTGALCGLSQTAGILTGQQLGTGIGEVAYQHAKQMMRYGLVLSLLLSALLLVLRGTYVEIYQVDDSVKHLTCQILTAYAVVAPFKIQNMILGGGILRSGGKTQYILWIDLIGTWGFGVPLGLLGAFVLKCSIPYVYFLLSLEECVRFGICLMVFRRRKWMWRLEV